MVSHTIVQKKSDNDNIICRIYTQTALVLTKAVGPQQEQQPAVTNSSSVQLLVFMLLYHIKIE